MRAYPEEGLSIVEVSKKTKNKLYAFSEGKLLAIMVLTCFFSLLLIDYIHEILIQFLFGFILFGMMFYFIYVRLGNMFRSENITYSTLGKIYFYMDFIAILNRRIDLFEIEAIEITSFDFEGKSRFSYHLYDPAVSLGIDNFLSLRFKNGVVERYQFKLIYDTQLYTFRKELVHYYKLGLIRELNLHDILGNQSFESKSDFRKHNPKYNTYPS